jgi:hypothetical protein
MEGMAHRYDLRKDVGDALPELRVRDHITNVSDKSAGVMVVRLRGAQIRRAGTLWAGPGSMNAEEL